MIFGDVRSDAPGAVTRSSRCGRRSLSYAAVVAPSRATVSCVGGRIMDPSAHRLRILGTPDPNDRVERATASYRASLRPATPGQPGLQRQGTVRMQPLLDEVLGPNHINVVIQGPAARSAAHTHDCDQVLVVVDGTARIETEWEQHDLPTGSVLLIPPRGCARACHDRRRRCGIHPVHPHRTRHHPVGVASYPSRATSPATGDTLGLSRGRGCHRRQCHVRSRVAPGALRWSATALQDVLTLRCGGRRRWC